MLDRAKGDFMRMPAIGLLLALCLLSGCASVHTNPAVPAFSEAVAAGTHAFATARSAEDQAFRQAALNAALGNGTVTTENCWQPGYDAARCRIVITVDGRPVDFQPAAPVGAALAQALAAYAQGMAQLSSATDIAEQQVAVQKLSAGLGHMATLLSIPGVGKAGDIVAEIQKAIAMKRRQAQLLMIAEHYEHTVGAAAMLLQAEALLLQENIVTSASQTVAHLEVMLATAPTDQRPLLVQKLVDATVTEQQAASLRIDLANQLKAAHAAMIAALRGPGETTRAALEKIGILASAFSGIDAALGGAATGPTRRSTVHE